MEKHRALHPHETALYRKFPSAIEFETKWFLSPEVSCDTPKGEAFLDVMMMAVLNGDSVLDFHSDRYINYLKISGLPLWVPRARRRSPSIHDRYISSIARRNSHADHINAKRAECFAYAAYADTCNGYLELIRKELIQYHRSLIHLPNDGSFQLSPQSQSYYSLGTIARCYCETVKGGVDDREQYCPITSHFGWFY